MRALPLLAIGRDWWLPPNYAVHGRTTDALFQWFFWITFAVFVAVEVTIVVFILKYRARPGRTRGRFVHGNTRLEMLWTVVPALILAGLALGNERAWARFRTPPEADDPGRTKILVIGQQFMWNVIYPGPDGKFGRYLAYPHATDRAWPVDEDGNAQQFAGVDGPATLPPKAAAEAVNRFIATQNPLGKDFSDPDGTDDDYDKYPGRPIYVPVDRPVEVQLQSKDVVHDFYLPNFRAQLYALPGTRGRFVFTPTVTTAELEAPSRRTVAVDDLIAHPEPNVVIEVGPTTPGAASDKYGWHYADAAGTVLVRDGQPFAADVPAKLKAAGVRAITVHTPHPFEVVCAQLCGIGHSQMRGTMIVLSQAEFDAKFPAAPHDNKEKSTTDEHR